MPIARITVPCITAVVLAGSLLVGCAGVDCKPPPVNPDLTPAQVTAAGGHTGERQRWGGTLASVRNLADRTELEVLGYPLDRCGAPRTGAQPIGRFILVQPEYLETADHPTGSRLSAIGLISGTREGQVGGASYRFPLLETNEIRWWATGGPDTAYRRPWVTIGIGGGSGGVGGGIGVHF